MVITHNYQVLVRTTEDDFDGDFLQVGDASKVDGGIVSKVDDDITSKVGDGIVSKVDDDIASKVGDDIVSKFDDDIRESDDNADYNGLSLCLICACQRISSTFLGLMMMFTMKKKTMMMTLMMMTMMTMMMMIVWASIVWATLSCITRVQLIATLSLVGRPTR